MSALGDDDRALAGEYAMGLLTGDEARAAQRRAAHDPAFAAEVLFWRENLAGLDDTTAPVAPPAALLGKIETRLFGRRRPFWASAFLGAGLAAGLAVLALVIVAPAPRAPGLVAQISAPVGGVEIAARYAGGVLQVTQLAGQAPAGRVLELWAIAGEGAPVSLGVLPGTGTVQIALADALAQPGLVLAISDEPPGGSPTGAPTGAVLGTAILGRG